MAAKAKDSLAEVDAGGKFVRTAAGFREQVSPEHPVFKPEADRYHLYISLACPWANRCDAVRRLKGLEHIIGCTVVHPTWQRTRPGDAGDAHCGWFFHDSSTGEAVASSTGHGAFVIPKCTPDPLGHKFIRDLYEASEDNLGKYSVPVLWDKQTGRIVNNESSEILRMINSQFNAFATNPSLDLTPTAHLAEIDAVNAMVYENINDGVYKCGFAKTQEVGHHSTPVVPMPSSSSSSPHSFLSLSHGTRPRPMTLPFRACTPHSTPSRHSCLGSASSWARSSPRPTSAST